ncbi:hypothetical protein COR50_02725 [Chitinophaga caeni]|uniref:Uncharacterized protein n=1 Tax=Chitinophaga caeni TaxID=2029983 RepID=A0A291QQF6_9BACT|nr:hypothetical protein [Chitinophaga caeni]ATL46166.1 hypothetical protein COR50_02725 [Chitinophaga caeni]
MNELELKQLWQTTNDKLEANFVLSKENADNITRLKVHNILGSMKPLKFFTILIGMLWVTIGSIVLSANWESLWNANKFFLLSAALQILLTASALFIYLFQLVKIYRVDTGNPILKTQRELAQLKISTLWSARILFLQLPLWTTFWWHESMFTNWNIGQWLVTLTITGSFTFLSLWLFFNIKYENRDKKWFKLIFKGKEWTPLMKSMELLDQINRFSAEPSADA